MKNIHLNRAFRPTPPCIRAAIEQGFDRGEKRMQTRYRLRTACTAAAAVLVVCGLALTAIHTLRPSPDRVQYAQGKTTHQPLTAVNFTAGEDGIVETPFASADDVAATHTLPVGTGEEAEIIALAQPEVAAAGTDLNEAETAGNISAETGSSAEESHMMVSGAEEYDALPSASAAKTEEAPAPEEYTAVVAEALPTPTPRPVDNAMAGTLQFSVEEMIYNEEYGYLFLRIGFDASDWMQVSTEIPSGTAFSFGDSLSISEISPALEKMVATSFETREGIRLAQLAVPEVILPDGTRPVTTRMIESEDGTQELLLAYIPDPKRNIPEYVNIGLHLSEFIVNEEGECLAVYSEPVALNPADGNTFTATGEIVTDKTSAYMQSVSIDVPVTRVRGGYAAKSGITHYWVAGFGDWIVFLMQQDYDSSNKELQETLEGSFILTLANGTEITLPISCMNTEREDDSEYWQVSMLLNAEECRTGDPATCRITTMDGIFFLSDMLETELPLTTLLEMVGPDREESDILPTPEPLPADSQKVLPNAVSDGPVAESDIQPTPEPLPHSASDGPVAEFDTSGN